MKLLNIFLSIHTFCLFSLQELSALGVGQPLPKSIGKYYAHELPKPNSTGVVSVYSDKRIKKKSFNKLLSHILRAHAVDKPLPTDLVEIIYAHYPVDRKHIGNYFKAFWNMDIISEKDLDEWFAKNKGDYTPNTFIFIEDNITYEGLIG